MSKPFNIHDWQDKQKQLSETDNQVVAKGDGLEITQDEMDKLHRDGRVRLKDGSLLVFPSKPLNVKEAIVDYDFSKEELIRVIKQLKRGASTEIEMIKAFEKALGRELTDDEIRGFKLKEDDIDESLNPEVSRSLDKFIRAMADRYDYTMQDAVYAIMAALKQRNYDGLGEASMTGTGASFNAGSGEGYMSPNAFGDDKKKKMKTYKSIGYKKI